MLKTLSGQRRGDALPEYQDLILSLAAIPYVGSPDDAATSREANSETGGRLVTVRLITEEAALFDVRTDADSSSFQLNVALPESPQSANGNPLAKSAALYPTGESAGSFDLEQTGPFWMALGVQFVARLREVQKRGAVGTKARPRRLKIAATGWLSDLPWEMLCDEEGRYLALSPANRIVRTIPRMIPVPPLTCPLPLKVLLVVPNPKTALYIDTNQELAALSKHFNAARETYEVQILVGSNATRSALQSALRDFQPQVVHYIGHAGISAGQGCLIFAGTGDSPDWVTPGDLSKMLPISTRLLCLATCCSVPNYNLAGLPRFAGSPGDIELPTIVANQFAVTPQTVQAFWPHFYKQFVASGGDVTAAVRAGRHKVVLASGEASLQWAAFRLVLRDQTGQSLMIVPRTDAQMTRTEKAQYNKEIQEHYTTQIANRLAQRIAGMDSEPTAYSKAPSVANEMLWPDKEGGSSGE